MSKNDKLFKAVQDGNLQAVRAALKAGADPNGASDDYREDMRALGIAMARLPDGPADDRAAVTLALIDGGADAKVLDGKGFSYLHYAAYFGNVQVVDALLAAGVDPGLLSKDSSSAHEYMKKKNTALEIAKRCGNKEVVARLEQAGGAPSQAPSPENDKLAALHQGAFQQIDFEGSDGEVTEELAGAKVEEHLFSIGMTGSGSVFALWSKKGKGSSSADPVVYLDSEGDPRSVVAASLDEFLSVLPYGTGFIYDVLNGKSPDAQSALKKAGGAEPKIKGAPFLAWWKKTFGVEPAADPVVIIQQASRKKPSLKTWLKTR